ncbi:hypothetical protein Pth03_74510 [Planotetraspora thailandica]|uniref:Transglycosylase SLT domain-containing protein n=1 Tax=Planotetraspora thailandica TaxID=487172 RepID=A0A8J3Y1C2_9ACTN|nr:lytic murein transglycosylase [Planotetraspora thailandica]GII59062.1 hypothetical protein Pth03_74510 [Planotetraspora thailandica]
MEIRRTPDLYPGSAPRGTAPRPVFLLPTTHNGPAPATRRARAMIARAAAMVTAVTLGGCAGPGATDGALPPAPGRAAMSTPAPTDRSPTARLLAADVPIPKDAARIADAIKTTTRALRNAVDAWTRDGDTGAQPPKPAVLLALHQQRIYRYLARHPDLARRVYDGLPAALAKEAEENVTAIADLFSLTRPISGSVKFRVQPAEPAKVLLGYFQQAERRFGVEWEVLAAVMLVESVFGRVRSDSYAGAQGPMQFMPATWKAYGLGGDVRDPRDAVFGAANYLRASGAPRDYQRALHAYNPTQPYVNAVLLYARQIKRDPRNYYAYYNWQVFVQTTKGDRRLTGPDPWRRRRP